jgi:hypothetical protein
MRMELTNERGQETFNNVGWKMLMDLALRHGWKPAGALAPDSDEHAAGGGESGEHDFVQLPQEKLEACELSADDPLAQAIKSVCLQPDDPALDSYFNNAGFRVTAEDARALAEALENALPDVPNHEALTHKTVELPGAPGECLLPLGTPVNPYEWFSGKNKGHLIAFIGFCRQGAFEIW